MYLRGKEKIESILIILTDYFDNFSAAYAPLSLNTLIFLVENMGL